MAETAVAPTPRSPSWHKEVAVAVATGVVQTHLAVHRWRRWTRWTLHGGLGALTGGVVGLSLAAPGREVSPARHDKPPFTLSPAAKAGIALGLGALVTGASRVGQSVDEWAVRALTARGVRCPRLWMGVAAAGASQAMSATDMRNADREQASTTRQDALDGPGSSG